MRFEKLLQHVQRAEQRVELRATHAQLQWATLKQTWREGWTPGRIVIAGLAGGFVAGKLEPRGAFSGARWLQMIGSVSGLVASAQASVASFAAAAAGMAAAQASDAADEVEQAADETAEPAGAGPAPARPRNAAQPGPAEAATELSES